MFNGLFEEGQQKQGVLGPSYVRLQRLNYFKAYLKQYYLTLVYKPFEGDHSDHGDHSIYCC